MKFGMMVLGTVMCVALLGGTTSYANTNEETASSPDGETAFDSNDPIAVYESYRDALLVAENIDDLKPYLSAELVAGMSDEEKRFMLGFLPDLIREGEQFEVVSSSTAGDEGKVIAQVCIDQDLNQIEVTMKRDEDGWKIVKEHYSSSFDVGCQNGSEL